MKLKMFFLILTILILVIIFSYFFIGKAPKAEGIIWGVTFSQMHSQGLNLDWQENYLAILDDLKAKDIKIITHWNLIEKNPGEFDFEDLDWQIRESEKREAKILLVIGMKTGRWPECHIPEWAINLGKEKQQERIIKLIQELVLRYKNSPAIFAWQIENEPFFPFGECPKISKEFLKREIDLTKSLDENYHPIVITDSGEGSFWFKISSVADIPGTTMYRKVWERHLKFYINYPFPSVFYWRKAQIIKNLFDKEVICTEFQTEPWGPKLLYESPLEEQKKTMDLEKFQENIEFAKKTGFQRFYLWGSEWWYWMKTKHDNSQIWNEAKKLF